PKVRRCRCGFPSVTRREHYWRPATPHPRTFRSYVAAPARRRSLGREVSAGRYEMVTLDEAVGLAAADNGLAFVATLRSDDSIQSSLINAGALAHPVSGEPVLGFVTYGKVKLANLRARPQIAVSFRNGWQWATVEG